MNAVQRDVESIFIQAAAIDVSGERRAFLDEQCGQDEQLRRRVESLLRAHDDAGSFLDGPPEDVLPTIAINSKDTVDESLRVMSLDFLAPCETPDRLGRLGQYEVIEVLGRGGMGVVLRAHDTKLNRIVAIKVMAPELAANPMAVKRFLREAEAAAAVMHDHVVSIHAIEDEVTPPYLVMEFVDGQSLQEKLDRSGALGLREILRIGMQAAAGLSAAHKQGLVHRDIKPANILLENGVERVKITDFGLARAVDDVNITRTGLIAGTPQYMSPEQAQGEGFDHRSDLFALGSVLYAMCTGRAAFRADNPMAVMRRVCDDEPRPIREINPDIPQWLEAIVEKLLAKHPGQRFQSAEEVSELLASWLAHIQQPAQVPPPVDTGCQPVSRVRKVVPQSQHPLAHKGQAGSLSLRRWPLIAAAAVLLMGILAFGAVVMIATDRGVLEVRSEVGDVQVSVTKNGEEVALVDVATGSKIKWLASDDYEVKLVGDDNDVKLDKGGFEMSRLGRVIVTAKWRDDDAGVIKRFSADEETITQDGVTAADGGWKITADKTRTVRLFETPLPQLKPGPFFYHAKIKTEHVKERAYLEMWVRYPGQGEFFSKGLQDAVSGTNGWSEYQIPFLVNKDGQKPDFVKLNLVVEGGGTVWIKDIALRGRMVEAPTRNDWVELLPLIDPKLDTVKGDWSRDGDDLLVAGAVKEQQVIEVPYEPPTEYDVLFEFTRLTETHDVSLGLSRDGDSFGFNFGQSNVHFGVSRIDGANSWARRPELALKNGRRYVGKVEVRADRITGYLDGEKVVSVDTTGSKLSRFEGTKQRNGRLLGISVWEGSARIHRYAVREVSGRGKFSRETWQQLFNGRDLTGWKTHADQKKFQFDGNLELLGSYRGHTDWISHVAYTSDGGRIVTSGFDETIRVWDSASGKLLRTINTHNSPLSIALSPDDQYVVAGMYQANVVMWNLKTGEILRPFVGHEVPKEKGLPGRMLSVAFSPDGATLASSGDDGTVRLWDVATGKQLRKLELIAELPADLPKPPVEKVTFTSDGKTVVAADYSGTVCQWNVADGKLIKTLRGQKYTAISPDGKWIAAGHKLFNAETNEHVCHLPYDLGGKASSVRFAPDSHRVAIGKSDGSLWVYEVPTGRVIAKVTCNKHVTNAIAVSPDGRFVATGGGAAWSNDENCMLRDGDYALRIWRLPEAIAPPLELTEIARCQGHQLSIFHTAYAPDGKHVYSVDGATLRRWDATTGELLRTIDVPEGSGWANSVTVSPDSKLVLTGHAQGKLTLWDAKSGELLRQWAPHKFRVDCVAFTPDGKYAVSACATHFNEGDAGPVKVHRTSDWEVASEFHVGNGGDVYGFALHPDSRHVLLSTVGPLQLRNLETGELVRTLDDGPGTQRRGVDIDATGRWAVTGSNNTRLVLWDLATGQQVRRFHGHGQNGPQVPGGGIIARVAFVPETNWIVSSGWDRTLRLWDRDTGIEIARDTGDRQSNQHVVVSPDGQHVVTGGGNAKVADGKYEGDGDYELRIWRVPMGAVEPDRYSSIDLQPQANTALIEGTREGSHLAELASGHHVLGSVPFDVGENYTQLGGGVLKDIEHYPAKVEGITVNAHADRLHFLHATQHTIAVDDASEAGGLKIIDGVPLARYVIHYADDTQEVIPIIHGEDIRDWWNWDNSKPCTRGKEVWHGSNPAIRKDLKNTGLRLFLTSWNNPHPERRIVSIDYQRADDVLADPFCVAITAESPANAKQNGADDALGSVQSSLAEGSLR